jgi:hypothetical protein
MTRPVSLTIAVVLQYVAAIVGIVTGVVLLLGASAMTADGVTDAINEQLQSTDAPITAEVIRWGVLAAALILIMIGILRVIIARALSHGHNWARILITVFAAFMLITGVAELFQEGQFWRGVGSVLLELVILWLLWNASSSAFIKAKTAERSLGKIERS